MYSQLVAAREGTLESVIEFNFVTSIIYVRCEKIFGISEQAKSYYLVYIYLDSKTFFFKNYTFCVPRLDEKYSKKLLALYAIIKSVVFPQRQTVEHWSRLHCIQTSIFFINSMFGPVVDAKLKMLSIIMLELARNNVFQAVLLKNL